ncbi:APC family permease [Rhizobium helianthi]|uniref:APC family permease n=1 Tax=Rhizobium helianthi TaxID=1132695 RepID=A0ABW4M436_9HYPH
MALSKSLTTLRGTGLMLNIVIGAGLLALPGMVVEVAGHQALWAWALCAIVAAPLLLVFVLMGMRFPDAGGISHFAQKAFGRSAYSIASMIFLGAVVFGLPAIALTGGHYLAEAFGGMPSVYAFGLVIAAAGSHLLSTEIAARVSTAIASIVLISLLALVLIGLSVVNWSGADPNVTPLSQIELPVVFAPFMMIFFAFTGWELAAGLSEEFRNPERDFPRAMFLSFIAACLIYFCMAFVAQSVPISGSYKAAFSSILTLAVGEKGRVIMGLLAGLIIYANLLGAIWAVSRMVYALSREGLLPLRLTTTSSGTPLSSVLLVSLALLIVLGFDYAGLLEISHMLELAGQNFLLLYGLSGLALLKLSKRLFDRLVAGSTVAIVVTLMLLQGTSVLYPLCLTVLGVVLARLRSQSTPAARSVTVA